jgi:hypothetical protein
VDSDAVAGRGTGVGWAVRWGDGTEEIGRKELGKRGGLLGHNGVLALPIREENPYSIF